MSDLSPLVNQSTELNQDLHIDCVIVVLKKEKMYPGSVKTPTIQHICFVTKFFIVLCEILYYNLSVTSHTNCIVAR